MLKKERVFNIFLKKTQYITLGSDLSAKLYEHLFVENANDPYDVAALMIYLKGSLQGKSNGKRNKTGFFVGDYLGIKVVGYFFKSLAHKYVFKIADLCTNHFLCGLVMMELSKYLNVYILFNIIIKMLTFLVKLVNHLDI